MPTLPDASALGELPTPQPATGVAQIQPGSPHLLLHAGAFFERAGGELDQAANVIQQTNLKYDNLAAEDASNQLSAQRMDLEWGPNGFRNVMGKGVTDPAYTKDYVQRLRDASSGISDGLANDQQRRLFQMRADARATEFRGQLLQHQSQQTQVFQKNVFDSTVSTELANIASHPEYESGEDSKLGNQAMQFSVPRINAAIDAQFGGKVDEATLNQIKDQHLGMAWASRVQATSYDSPWAAYHMLRDHAEQMAMLPGYERLNREVLQATDNVTQRDIANKIISGFKPTSPTQLTPGLQNRPPYEAVIQHLESGNQGDYDASGRILTSAKGAIGRMQVMPDTLANPGFGIEPARDDSPQETARVGREVVGALTAKYDNPALVYAAYNAGTGKVDQWLAKYGDPRLGHLSTQDWVDKIPFPETKDYVQKGLRASGMENYAPQQSSNPTARDLASQLPQYVQAAHDLGAQLHPGNPAFADGLSARVETLGRLAVQQQKAGQDANADTVISALRGQQPDGSDAPKTMDELLASPQNRAAYNASSEQFKYSVQQRLAKGDKTLDANSYGLWSGLYGDAMNPETRDKFLATDLGSMYGKMPDHLLMGLREMQGKLGSRELQDEERDKNHIQALQIAEQQISRIGGPRVPKESDPEDGSVKQNWRNYTGLLLNAVDQFHTDNKRWPSPSETFDIGSKMTAQVQVPGRFFGTNTTPAWRVGEKIPADARAGLTASLAKKFGTQPTELDLNQAYMIMLQKQAAAAVTAAQSARKPAVSGADIDISP